MLWNPKAPSIYEATASDGSVWRVDNLRRKLEEVTHKHLYGSIDCTGPEAATEFINRQMRFAKA